MHMVSNISVMLARYLHNVMCSCVHFMVFLRTGTCTGITDINLTTTYQGYYCPNKTAIFTCRASNTTTLHWEAKGQSIASVSSLGRVSTINNDAYTVTFINDSNNTREYLTSTLQVAVDKIGAVTNVSCLTRNKAKHLLIIKQCKPIL